MQELTLCFEDPGSPGVSSTLSHSPWHEVWTYRLWLQNPLCFVNDFYLRSERFLRFFFFFFSSLSPWIAAYMSKLPWWLWMLPACPQLSCNIWSGVLVCQWAGQSLKHIFVCKRCFLKSFKPLQRPLRFSKTLWTSTSSEKVNFTVLKFHMKKLAPQNASF